MGGRTKPISDHCTGWKPVFTSCDDVLTNSTALQIKNHDEYGVAEKCWQKPKPNPKACKKTSPQSG